MKKILGFTILAVAFGITLKAQPQTTPGIDPNAPVMKLKVDTIDFGTVTQGTIVEKEFKFSNSGKSPLVISSTSGSCRCTVADFPKEPVAPGRSGVIKVVFDSTGKMGYQLKTATINSNNRDGTVILYLKGAVVLPPTPPPADGFQK